MTDDIRASMRKAAYEPEATALRRAIDLARLDQRDRRDISRRGAELVRQVRSEGQPGIMESFLAEYGLSTKEGVALMCLAEALLRVPDADTIDRLIQDKIAPHDWGAHLGDSGSILVNASTWALMLTGRVLDDSSDEGVAGALRGVVRRLGEPVIRTAVGRAMREMGAQFVLGRDISEAMSNGEPMVERGYTYSYDMLGEAARTQPDAARYHGAYAHAIAAISARATSEDIRSNPGISVKLSALHPRYEYPKRASMLPELVARLLQLARAARDAGIGLNIDAEEADRLDLSLDVIEQVFADPSLAGWDGFGVVVQAYGQRAPVVIDWLYQLATRLNRRMMIRLVKGAYWDTEIKRAQVMGLGGFPVFTHKANTDVSYIGCARSLLDKRDRIYPQFATHNAHTMAAVLHMAGPDRDSFEFQRLHGMGEVLHAVVTREERVRSRIYAPVGAHRDLLAYLVRRLLENGANSSFVHQIIDEDVSPEQIARDPFEAAIGKPNTAIVLPPDLWMPERKAARGWDLSDPIHVTKIETGRAAFARPHRWDFSTSDGPACVIVNPADASDIVGEINQTTPKGVAEAVSRAMAAQPQWTLRSVRERADILNRAADLYEVHAAELFALVAREAGKTLQDGIAEVREAVDFLRYYSAQAEGAERGTEARGVIACISPWNFPLAIFTGQIAAALATGNAVVAKPAEQTPLIAARAVELMRMAGLPDGVLELIIGDGPDVGAPLTADPRIGGVVFTGSIEVAKTIDRQLSKSAPDAMFIAETGGINAMIVDSTALAEQAVRDIMTSAFQSAGQRCSALRILYIQRDVEERVLEMLFGAMDVLTVADPWHLNTDVGPVIDREAFDALSSYCEQMEARGRLLKKLTPLKDGLFVPPAVFRVSGIGEIDKEVFGPILHVATFDGENLSEVLSDINAKGYGLTMGLHTRIDRRVQEVVDRAEVGNLYVNRNQIGAIVGSQPFGGEGLSGTGPKAGGPHYVARFRKARQSGLREAMFRCGEVTAQQVTAALEKLASAKPLSQDVARAELRGAFGSRAEPVLKSTQALNAGPIELPGPTGESNRLRLAPRGRVLCLGPTAEDAIEQAVQALYLGNHVVIVVPEAGSTLTPPITAGLPCIAIEGEVSAEVFSACEIDAVAWFGDPAPVRQRLAERAGPIVPLISNRFDPAAYTHERVVCIDTTAAGGNAALLSKAA